MNVSRSFSPNDLKLSQDGFTLIELVIVVAVIGIIAAIAFPSYQSSVKKSNRVDMMTDMGKISNNIAREKIAFRQYEKIKATSVKFSDYDYYDVSIAPLTASDTLTSKWVITATPKTDARMAGDGNLTLSVDGKKCRDTKCGEKWKD